MMNYENKVILGDCVDVMAEMPDNYIDLTITSPPYDSLRTYKGSLEWDEGVWVDIIDELYRITKDGGVVIWVVGDSTFNGSESGTSFKQALYFKDCGFNIYDTMIYQKNNFSNPSKTRYHQTFEYMFCFSKGNPKTFNPIMDRKNKYAGKIGSYGKNTVTQKDGSKIERERKINKEYGMRHNVWLMNTTGQTHNSNKIKHPATFPERLVNDCIISWSNPGDIIFDPLAGSGTTLKVAKKLHRKFIGIEKVKEYYDLCIENTK